MISHLFPNEEEPYLGKYVFDQFTTLSDEKEIEIDLVVPTPFSIPFTKRWKRNHSLFPLSSKNITRVYYLSFPKKKLAFIAQRWLSFSLFIFFRKRKYDLAHMQFLYPDGLALPFLKKKGFKCIVSTHGSDWYKNQTKAHFSFLEKSINKTDLLLCSGPILCDDIRNKFQNLKHKIQPIYNAVDPDVYTLPAPEKKLEANKRLSSSTENINILTVANVRLEKGIDLLLTTAEQFLKKPNIQFHIVGALDDTEYSRSMFSKIKSLENVHYYEPVSPERLVDFYHAADLYVAPSRNEGFGLALVEAATTGLPVLSTPVGIATTFIDDNVGILCTEITSDSIYRNLDLLINNYKNYSPEKIRDKAITHYGKDTISDKLISYYRMVVHQSFE